MIQGTPALVLLAGTGSVVLAIALQRLLHPASAMAPVAFVAGIACGYLPPLVLRIARVVGRDRMERTGWLRLLFLFLFFVPLVSPLFGLLFVSPALAQVFGLGTLAMVLLGLGLQDDGPPVLR